MYRVSDRPPRRFRVWAVALIVILMLPFNVGSLFVTVPEIGAATLSYLLLALTLERGPRVPRAVR